MTTRDDLAPIMDRITGFARMAMSVERHLLEDQADAVAPGAQDTSRGSTGGSGHGDPTASKGRALAPFAGMARELHASIRGVAKALDDAERTMTRLIARKPDAVLPGISEPLCSGWRTELQERLGGCGKRLEYWRDANGNDHPRADYLCVSCRKDKERTERQERAA